MKNAAAQVGKAPAQPPAPAAGASAAPAGPAVAGPRGLGDATARVARSLLEGGAVTATELASRLFLTPTAVRRHLDALIERGLVSVSDEPQFGPSRGQRGRGRPARYYCLTSGGRDVFESSYDDVALSALSFLASRYGEAAIDEYAATRRGEIAARYAAAAEPATPAERAAKLAELLTADGYATSTAESPHGVQLCQHHCPLSHVAEQFGQFCEAERQAFADILGVHVTRLSTIATGGGVCTTVVPTAGGHASLAGEQPETSGSTSGVAAEDTTGASARPDGKDQP